MSDTTTIPGEESVRASIRDAELEDAFWREHYDDLLKQYPGQFIAVARDSGQIVAVDPHLDGLVDKIKAKGLAVKQVWGKFMAATPTRLIL